MRTRRLERCGVCALPQPVCLCGRVRPIPIATRLLVLVHWIEAFKTTNTGRLAQLAFDARYERWGARDQPLPTLPEGPLLLLFPFEDARLLVPSDRGATLVIPDGNWPQARKIARRVHARGDVTSVRIAEEPSRYSLRRTKRPFALSTFESIAHALGTLEGERGPEVTAQSLAIFDAFVERHARFAAGDHAIAVGDLG